MRTRATTITAVLLLALTACSSSDDDTSADPKPSAPTTSSTPSSEPSSAPSSGDDPLETAVKEYTEAYFAAEASTAHRMLSERCRKEINPLVYGETLRQAKKDYGSDHPATDVTAEVSGDLARVSYKIEGLPKFDQQAQPWAREDGVWKYDAC
ncbi:hypothetical protein DIZ27_23160 [Streptomyces sp. NWU339]|nr:hypothetical protein DIZ27_23160 [Streptomyces sp. NWU339]